MALRILAGGAAQSLVETAKDGFEIEGTFSAVGAMRDKLLAGEPADIVILSRALVEGLAQSGHVVAGTMADVARVATAVAVRARSPARHRRQGRAGGGPERRRRDPLPRSGPGNRRHPLRQGDA
ncbi:substrate-binding domain-containing protein [Reyranella sp.]|uniref:substrate-binding domain-containing protein n=1 Tax=Reyranella sp. TaxID=1929291 RepID=UPI0025D93B60|nr:substrate-binding domain-containing protein [Reyranella sp.]